VNPGDQVRLRTCVTSTWDVPLTVDHHASGFCWVRHPKSDMLFGFKPEQLLVTVQVSA
jgi:hypothetical protein